MKPSLLTLAALALVGRCRPRRRRDGARSGCRCELRAGMTASAPGVCSLPGYRWELTTHYLSHGETRTDWMLLPNR